MNIKRTAALLISAVFITCTGLADAPPTLALSKAAKLAEDAIASASLPADCFLRSITLIQSPEAPAYYQASYKPAVTQRVRVGDAPPPRIIDIIRITMDGKVTFEQKELHVGAAPIIRVK